MVWALAVAGGMVILLGGLAIHGRVAAKRVNRKLGEKEAEVVQLKKEILWFKNALARQSESDPDLDELAVVSDFQANRTA